ncbi:CHAT domain-containing protein [Mycolicibacterium sp.]|uniref:CHAT domain-containing protein n=1 Tax=Mycolicibacterium sp. TaxID=2320850 RepID=UPI001A31ABA2|nr:CHAT domain-containing protein [Mycolicibacterium sp.]MBJ7336056.1 CHAT domain-containing protein [Mycolicibacterium sp.]
MTEPKIITTLTESVVRRLLRETADPRIGARSVFLERLHEILALEVVRQRLGAMLGENAEDPASARLRLALTSSDDPELVALPWELARLPNWNGMGFDHDDSPGLLGRHPQISVLRYVPTVHQPGPYRWGPIVAAIGSGVGGALRLAPGETRFVQPSARKGGEEELLREALGNYAGDLTWCGEPATNDSVKRALSTPAFGFYFGGHHVDGGVIVAEDDGSPFWLSAEELAMRLVAASITLAILVACRSAESPGASTSDDPIVGSTAQRLVEAGVPFVVAIRNEIAEGSSRRFIYRLLQELTRGTPLDRAMTSAATTAESAAEPCAAVLFTSQISGSYAIVRPPALRVPKSLRAYRVPLGWNPLAGPCPIGDRTACDLGPWLCLDRGGFTALVASGRAMSLAEELDAVERGPIADGNFTGGRADRDRQPRRWRTVQISVTERELKLLSSPFEALGIVVVVPVTRFNSTSTGGDILDVYRHVRLAQPDPAVVIHLQADNVLDAIVSSSVLGAKLSLESPVEVLAWTRPGDWPPTAAGLIPRDEPENVARRLMSTVAHAQEERALPRHSFAVGGAPLPADSDVRAVSASVVAALESRPIWGDPYEEAEAIRLIRDFAPEYYRPLITAHAAGRTDQYKWASFYVAAAFDEDVDVWIDAAGGIGSPQTAPRAMQGSMLTEAGVFGLLRRRASVDELAPWMESSRNRCAAAYSVALRATSYNRDAGTSAEFLQSAIAEVGIAAQRAQLANLAMDTVPQPLRSIAWWAALGRSPLRETPVSVLAAGGPAVRAVVDSGVDLGDLDPAIADQVLELRAAMKPPLSQLER